MLMRGVGRTSPHHALNTDEFFAKIGYMPTKNTNRAKTIYFRGELVLSNVGSKGINNDIFSSISGNYTRVGVGIQGGIGAKVRRRIEQ